MNASIRLSIVVPCYNEEENIPQVVQKFSRVLHGRTDIELLLVDNGSQDKTGACIDSEIARQGCPYARKVSVPVNEGYGWGILCGLRAARGEVLAWTHADLQPDPQDVLRAYELYQVESKKQALVFVKGHRHNRPLGEMFFSYGMQLLSSLALGMWFSEVNAQPKLFPRAFYEMMTDAPKDFSLDLYVLYLARKKGYRMASIPVDFKKRAYGVAKGGSGSSWIARGKLIWRTLRYIFKLRAQLKKG